MGLFFTLQASAFALSENPPEKVVVITGASRGIGLASAEYLASQGYIVYGTVRASSNTEKLDDACKLYPDHLYKIVLDLTDEQQVTQAINSIVQAQGKIDVLVNNAAYVLVGTVESCTIQEQIDLFNINYFGTVRTIQAVLPDMRKHKAGKIINIGSVSGIAPYSPWENYSAAKFALRGLSESMAASLSPWNIHVSIVEPATVKTQEMTKDPFGTRLLQENDPYAFIRNYESEDSEGMDPVLLGKLLQKIIETETPHVRYQIGAFAEELAKSVYVDPTGDAAVQSNIEYYKSIGVLPNHP